MKIKTSKGLKVTIIAVVLLLCLALAIGITGAFYQAKRQATGTLSMDQGIIIDYKGFGKTPDEGIWTRETTTTFLLFDETNAQPGEEITVNAAGIRANEKSVNFYARVKLSYKFYNGETPVELADATKLIKTSSSFFGTNWVESGDGYYYYATGSTLNKFAKTATTFVDFFATDAKFIIEGAGFTGANNNGEGGGFVDGTTSINKIEVYLTLETLQGDATAEQAKALGWEITTGGTEGEKVVELTPEDYTSTTTTDTATGEEKTIYTPSETFVGKNPKYAFTFSLNDTDKTATITGPVGNPTELDIPSKLVVNNEEYVTRSIGQWAFGGTDLKSIDLPDSLINIGIGAFVQCGNLKFIKIPDSVEIIDMIAFSGSALKNIELSSNLKIIGALAFVPCKNLTSIIIPSSVTNIGQVSENSYGIDQRQEGYAFSCPNLNSIIVNKDNVRYKGISNCLVDTTIGTIILGSINGTIPTDKNITRIKGTAFATLNLTSIIIPDNITSIDENAFAECTKLKSVTLSNKLTSIEEDMFSNCENLTSIVIGQSVTKIADNAFFNCYRLVEVYNLSSLNILQGENSNGGVGKYAKIINNSIDIPTKIVEGKDGIAYYVDGSTKIAIALRDNTKTKVVLSDDCTEIYDNAFRECKGITSILIGQNVISIGARAFEECLGLTSITIPKNIANIGNYAFYRCYALAEVFNLSSLEITPGTYGNGYIGYYAKVVHTSADELTNIVVENGVAYYVNGSTKIVIGIIDKTLATINLLSGCTKINDYAFWNCDNIKSINIPTSVESIGENIAAHTAVNSILIPSGVKEIAQYAFFNFRSLTTVLIDSTTIAGLGSSDSNLLDNATKVYVKDGLTVGSYITGSFTKAASSDREGYVLYTKNA